MKKLSFYERQHIQHVLSQQNQVGLIFSEFCSSVGTSLKQWTDTGKSSVWIRNSAVENAIDRQLIALQSSLLANIHTNQGESWELSNIKNDYFLAYVQSLVVNKIVDQGMFARNTEALVSLQQRTTNGMNLSEKVWRITDQTKAQLEFYLKSGLSFGRPAALISQDVRQLLENPNKRFHRIRNEEGELFPSQPMKGYHPGIGQYRSSKMNALRLAATETNIAYRMADHKRWSKLDFISGIEIRRSPSAKEPCKICDPLAGEYPKDFIFTVWHPFCMCFATPKVPSPEELAHFSLTKELPENRIVRNIPSLAFDFMRNNEYMRDSYAYKDNKKWFEGNQK